MYTFGSRIEPSSLSKIVQFVDSKNGTRKIPHGASGTNKIIWHRHRILLAVWQKSKSNSNGYNQRCESELFLPPQVTAQKNQQYCRRKKIGPASG
jgi:hypothetical protein